MKKYTLVIGGSENTDRYSNRAIRKLISYGHDVKSIGLREGNVKGVSISVGKPDFKDIDTVTIYISKSKQKEYYDYVLGLNPKRIVFNPGTINDEFKEIAQKQGIEVVQKCTLIMLDTGQY